MIMLHACLYRSDIVEVKACEHTALMGNICCDCGVLLEEKDIPKDQSVSMLHSVPDLKIARNVSVIPYFPLKVLVLECYIVFIINIPGS